MPARRDVTVSVILVNPQRQMLMFHRSGTEQARGWYSLPGGRIEEGESLLESVVREAKEEIGVEIDPADLTFAGVYDRLKGGEGPDRSLYFFFVARVWQGEPRNLEPDKHSELGWYDLDALPEPLHPLDRLVVDRNFDAAYVVVPGKEI